VIDVGRSRRVQALCASLSGLTPSEKWLALYGTTASGNLPQWKKDQHEGHCWHPCPYSTQSTALKTRHLRNLGSGDPLPTKVDHSDINGKEYFMRTQRKWMWGYECTFDDCPYYLDNGERYFYG